MSKKLDRLYIRGDARFPSDERYQALPRAMRDSAYLFFLALNGWSRDKKTDGRVPLAMAHTVGREMEHAPARTTAFLAALAAPAVALIRLETDAVVILKYRKWQDTRQEIEERNEARREAGRKGGLESGRSRREANASPLLEPVVEANAKQNEAETETETETETLAPPVAPPGGAADGLATEDLTIRRYVERWMGHSGRAPSADDLAFARRIPYEFPRLGEAVVLEAITEVANKHLARQKPVPRMKYLAGKLADLNAAAADAGVSVRRGSSGMSRLGDLLPGSLP